MDKDLEIRISGGFDIETRADGGIGVKGHAAVFNTMTDIGGFFREQFKPGAFADVIKDDVRFLIEHEGLPLARTASKTLKISEDKRGLAIEASLDPTDPDVLRILPKIQRGDLDQMSIAFTMRGGIAEWDETDPDSPIRTIEKVGGLFDVSVVAFGAYPTTDVGLRSLKSNVRLGVKMVDQRRKRLELAEREFLYGA